MSTTPSLATLLVKEGKAAIYRTGLSIANLVGVDTTTWRAGDPTRSLYHLESEFLDVLEDLVIGWIQSDFIQDATGVWLKITAKQKYNVDVPDATFASTKVVITNVGGGVYDVDPNDITFRDKTTGKTFHNTSGGHLGNVVGVDNGLIVDVEADEAGSASSAAAGDIEEFVESPFLDGVSCTNPTAAIGVDEQDPDTTRDQCIAKTNSISPNGSYDAYRYVARNQALTTASIVPRVRAFGDGDTGRVSVYVTGPSGTISSTDVGLIQTAILRRCTPICVTPTVIAATPIEVDVDYAVYLYRSVKLTTAEIEDAVETELEKTFTRENIGGDRVTTGGPGYLYASRLFAAIRKAAPDAFRIVVTTPDTLLNKNHVATLGTVTGTIIFVDDPS